MAKKYGHAKILSDADKALGGKLPPVLAGPPSWVPPGYVCTPADVQSFEVPGHRRATAKDKAEYAAAWNKARAEQAAEAARRRAERKVTTSEPTASTRPAPQAETSEQYLARALSGPGPRPLPADTPVAFFDERGADFDPLPSMRPLRRADY